MKTGISKPVLPYAVQIPLHNINLEARGASLGLHYSEKSMWVTSTLFQKQKLSSSSIDLFFWILIIFITSALQKNQWNNTHSIIGKHLAKIPWETNYPKQARNLRALPLAGQRNVLKQKIEI